MIMIVLALLLLAVAAFLIVVAVVEGGGEVQAEVLGLDVDTTIWGVFLGGVVAGLLVLAGLIALKTGIQQVQANRKEIEHLRQRVAEQERTERVAGLTSAMNTEGQGAGDDRPQHVGQPADLP